MKRTSKYAHEIAVILTIWYVSSIIAVRPITKRDILSKPTILNTSQIAVLEAALANNGYLNQGTVMQLARQTGLSQPEIRRWAVERKCHTKEGAVSISELIC